MSTCTDTTSLFINGEWLAGEGEQITSLNPATGDTAWQKQAASAAQVDAAIAAAQAAQPAWAALSLQERQQLVERFAETLEANKADLARCISEETGKPDWEAATEATAMINKVAISVRALNERAGDMEQPQIALAHRPHGVMAVFGPYNFPGHLPNGHIVPALLAGNTVVFKPSEETPRTAEKTVQLWQQAGLPAGVVNLVQGARPVGEALSQGNIDGLLFTGSSHTGKILHSQFAGRPEVLLALEMGGNNALIVDQDVNVDTAVNLIAQSAFLSAGQRCTCARRLIVVESAQTDALLQQLTALCDRLIADHPSAQPEPFMGPVINQRTRDQLLAAQQQLLELGGVSLRTMAAEPADSNFLTPALIDMTNAQQPEDEEWFGPLLQIFRVSTIDDAIALANNTRFGLAAGLISDNADHQQQFKNQIKAGVISLNKPTAGASSALPFGGVGASGNHRPSAFYAADYCAWPQAQSLGEDTHQQEVVIARGVR